MALDELAGREDAAGEVVAAKEIAFAGYEDRFVIRSEQVPERLVTTIWAVQCVPRRQVVDGDRSEVRQVEALLLI